MPAAQSRPTGPDINGKAMRRVRTLLGISLTDLASRTDTTIGHLSNIEAGRRGLSWPLYKAICDELADGDLETFLNKPRRMPVEDAA